MPVTMDHPVLEKRIEKHERRAARAKTAAGSKLRTAAFVWPVIFFALMIPVAITLGAARELGTAWTLLPIAPHAIFSAGFVATWLTVAFLFDEEDPS